MAATCLGPRRRAKASGDPAESHRLLRQSLQRWRGPVLAGLDCEFIAAAALGMEEEPIAASEDFNEAAPGSEPVRSGQLAPDM
ncbi:BTAD domain-containing putative transcriptional regulator [Glycomyces rhizosphaerae]|uniref:BTAD domain-containing putative transcriptional regulator n=1 Tax=Glycomyces rhizosphaerae TaxID=2054422 RepID=A0ABV7PX41_9ACTN